MHTDGRLLHSISQCSFNRRRSPCQSHPSTRWRHRTRSPSAIMVTAGLETMSDRSSSKRVPQWPHWLECWARHWRQKRVPQVVALSRLALHITASTTASRHTKHLRASRTGSQYSNDDAPWLSLGLRLLLSAMLVGCREACSSDGWCEGDDGRKG